MRPCLIALPFLAACASVSKEDAQKAVMASFQEANPPGRTGLELGGRSVWLRATWFENKCLEEKDLAFNDDPNDRPASARGTPRISPTYKNQRYLTWASDKGYCVYLGDNPTLSIEGAEWVDQKWRIRVTYGMEKPTPWFECLSEDTRQRNIEVGVKDEKPVVLSDLSIAPGAGACPRPLPGGEVRGSASRPTAPAPKAPSRDEVIRLLTAFDKALGAREYEKALGMVSCYNFFEDKKYGSCTVAELLNLSPMAGGSNPNEGPPWLEYTITSPDQVGAITKDGGDPSVYNVRLQSVRKGSKPRSMAVQWVDGEWRILSVVSRLAESITTMRFLYDLDRKEKRVIFEKRMKGEKIDDNGEPITEWVEMDPEAMGPGSSKP